MDNIDPNAPPNDEQETPKVLENPTLQVKMGERTTSLGDLMAAAQQGGKLEDYQKDVRTMLLEDPSSQGYRQAAERVLKSQGFSAVEIQEYLNPPQAPGGEEEEDVDEILERYEKEMGVGHDEEEEGSQEVAALKAEVAALKQAVARQGQADATRDHEAYTRTLEQSVNTQLDSNERLRVVFGALGRHNSGDPEYLKKVRPKYADQVRQRALQMLRERVAREGQEHFRTSWIESATALAATAVGEDLAAVIGNLDTLGRSPETASQMQVPLKKVEPPKPGTQATAAETEQGLEAWLNYRINKAAQGGGETKA